MFNLFQRTEWKRKMKALKEKHIAQKKEVGLPGWSGEALLPMTSSHPSALHPSLPPP